MSAAYATDLAVFVILEVVSSKLGSGPTEDTLLARANEVLSSASREHVALRKDSEAFKRARDELVKRGVIKEAARPPPPVPAGRPTVAAPKGKVPGLEARSIQAYMK